jgi:glycosyltransferase involved in cell wall biosynthesis
MIKDGVVSVAIDAFAMADGSQYRGVGTYLRHLLDGLVHSASVEVSAFVTPGVVLPDGVQRRPQGQIMPSRLQGKEHAFRLHRQIPLSGCDVFHSPAQAPPRRLPVPWVQTLHDLTPLVFRHPLLERDRRRWLALGPRLREAEAIICVSKSSAEQGVRLLGLDPERLHVVPLAVGPEFRPGPVPESQDPPYLLWVSSWGPHKGLAECLGVLELLAESGYPQRLVVGGRQDSWMRRQVEREVARSPVRDRVTVTGWVDDLASVYRAASVVIVSSRAEGFGLPALEALACGAPVVSFDNTSLPEVVLDAGLLVPDGDVVAMSAAVRKVLDNPGLRCELAARGPQRAAETSWQRVVDAHTQIYTDVAAHDR